MVLFLKKLFVFRSCP